jgi:hypothetical protein
MSAIVSSIRAAGSLALFCLLLTLPLPKSVMSLQNSGKVELTDAQLTKAKIVVQREVFALPR